MITGLCTVFELEYEFRYNENGICNKKKMPRFTNKVIKLKKKLFADQRPFLRKRFGNVSVTFVGDIGK